MKLDTQLTESSDCFSVAGLNTVTDYDDEAEIALYSTSTIEEWANELSGIESPLEVSIQDVEHGSGELKPALVARVPETDIVCFAAPLIHDDLGDGDEDDGEGEDEGG